MAGMGGRYTRGVIIEKWTGPGVMVFREKDCQVGMTGIFQKGEFNSKDLDNNHVGNRAAKGIHVDAGLVVTMFAGDNFTGKQMTITGPATYCQGWG